MKIGQLIGASIRELASVGIFENGQTVLGDHARFPEIVHRDSLNFHYLVATDISSYAQYHSPHPLPLKG